MVEYEAEADLLDASILSAHRHGNNVTLIGHGYYALTFKLGRKKPVYRVGGQFIYLTNGGQS